MHPSTKPLNDVVRVLAIAAIVLLAAAACQDQPVGPSPEPVTVQLKWVHQAQFAGFYLAREKGYYAAENLEVTLLEGGPEIDVFDRVASGEADFGIVAPERLIVERAQGRPVTAVAVIYRRNPLVFVTLADSGIERPEDFLGHTVALAPDAQLQFYALLERMRLDPNQVESGPYDYDYTPFYNGEVDITFAYATGGLIRMSQSDHQVNQIWPSDYGLHLYADTLITGDNVMAEQPELVTRFLRATLRGWREAIEDTEEAVSVTMKYAREADVGIQTQMMEASLPLIHTGQDQIGWMRPEIWQGMEEMLLEQGLLARPVDLSQVYTMTFLQQVYDGGSP